MLGVSYAKPFVPLCKYTSEYMFIRVLGIKALRMNSAISYEEVRINAGSGAK